MEYKMDWIHTGKVFLSSAIVGSAVWFSYEGILQVTHSNTLSSLLSIVLGGIVFLVAVLITKTVTAQDVREMPKVGNQLANISEKLTWK